MAYRVLLALAAIYRLEIEQIDVITAFLHSKLYEIIFMEEPMGYNDGSTRVCRLLRALYGLKQLPRV